MGDLDVFILRHGSYDQTDGNISHQGVLEIEIAGRIIQTLLKKGGGCQIAYGPIKRVIQSMNILRGVLGVGLEDCEKQEYLVPDFSGEYMHDVMKLIEEWRGRVSDLVILCHEETTLNVPKAIIPRWDVNEEIGYLPKGHGVHINMQSREGTIFPPLDLGNRSFD